MESWIFWPTASLSVVSAVWMAMASNAVHSALALVLNFFTLAVFFVLLDAHFLAAAQVVVYAGAIMVLFLFVIMLLGVDRREDLTESIRFHRGIAWVLGGVLAGLTVYTVRIAFSTTPFQNLDEANRAGNVEGVGRLLFSRYLWPFEVTTLLLIVAAIAVMVIGRRAPRRDEPPEEER